MATTKSAKPATKKAATKKASTEQTVNKRLSPDANVKLAEQIKNQFLEDYYSNTDHFQTFFPNCRRDFYCRF
jgi:hypothetical protein